jgi:hypothetical protein
MSPFNSASAPVLAPVFDSASAPVLVPVFDNATAPIFVNAPAPMFDNASAPMFNNASAPMFDNASAPMFNNASGPTSGTTTLEFESAATGALPALFPIPTVSPFQLSPDDTFKLFKKYVQGLNDMNIKLTTLQKRADEIFNYVENFKPVSTEEAQYGGRRRTKRKNRRV